MSFFLIKGPAVCLPSVVKDHQPRQADLEIVQIEKPFILNPYA
jgi:hypothetical protein